jgi:hypothetical protein
MNVRLTGHVRCGFNVNSTVQRVLLCGVFTRPAHHLRFVHEHGWHITTNSNNQFEFRRPDWTLYPTPKPQLEPRLAVLVERPT